MTIATSFVLNLIIKKGKKIFKLEIINPGGLHEKQNWKKIMLQKGCVDILSAAL